MTDEEIYQIIDEHKEETDALYERIHEQVEASIVQYAVARKKRQRIMTRVFSVVGAFVLILSLAIVLPIVLQPDGTTPEGDPVIWYSDTDISSHPLDYSLKEYAIKNNESFLYIDLGYTAEDLKTRRYYKKDDESITVYLQESFTHGEWGYSVKLTLMKSNIVAGTFDRNIKEPAKLEGFAVDINYQITRAMSYAQFEYDGYKYYLQFEEAEGIDEDFIADIISNMFNTQQATA